MPPRRRSASRSTFLAGCRGAWARSLAATENTRVELLLFKRLDRVDARRRQRNFSLSQRKVVGSELVLVADAREAARSNGLLAERLTGRGTLFGEHNLPGAFSVEVVSTDRDSCQPNDERQGGPAGPGATCDVFRTFSNDVCCKVSLGGLDLLADRLCLVEGGGRLGSSASMRRAIASRRCPLAPYACSDGAPFCAAIRA